MKAIIDFIHKISKFMFWIAMADAFIIGLLTFVDATGRYVFNHPLAGTFDIVEQSMIIICFGTSAYLVWNHRHISLDLLTNRLAGVKRSVVGIIANLFWIAALTPFTVSFFFETQKRVMNLRLTTPTTDIPLAPFYLFGMLGTIMLIIELIIDIINYVKIAGVKSSSEEAEIIENADVLKPLE